MFAAQVPERMIKDVIGHKALALYERPTLGQKQALSKVLAGGPASSSSTSFSEEVEKLRCNQSVVQRSEHHLHAKLAVPPGLFSTEAESCHFTFMFVFTLMFISCNEFTFTFMFSSILRVRSPSLNFKFIFHVVHPPHTSRWAIVLTL